MRITTMFGAPSSGCAGVGHHGVESATVRPIVPSKGFVLLHRSPFDVTATLRQRHEVIDSDARRTIAVMTSRVGTGRGAEHRDRDGGRGVAARAASSTSVPRANSARKTPLCVSPAPLVSRTVVSKAATCDGRRSRLRRDNAAIGTVAH